MVESGDFMLMGEYHHNLDEKLRLIIPSKLRMELGEEVVITRGLENCLFVYSLVEWNKIVDKLKKLPFTKKNARNFNRFLLSGAIITELDKQGRANITSSLISFANLEKDCIIIGVNDRLEIWSKDNWDNFFNENSDKLSDIAEDLFTGDIDLDI